MQSSQGFCGTISSKVRQDIDVSVATQSACNLESPQTELFELG